MPNDIRAPESGSPLGSNTIDPFEWEWLVKKIAKQCTFRLGPSFDDLVNEGWVGFLGYIRQIEETESVFEPKAASRIYYAIRLAIRQSRLIVIRPNILRDAKLLRGGHGPTDWGEARLVSAKDALLTMSLHRRELADHIPDKTTQLDAWKLPDLSCLTARQAEAVSLMTESDLSERQLASRMGCNRTTAMRHWTTAITKLQAQVKRAS